MGEILIKNVVFDFNGTIAVGGKIQKEQRNALKRLVDSKYNFKVFVLTSDTFGIAKKELEEFIEEKKIELTIFPKKDAGIEKMKIVQNLGTSNTIAIGNGNNDIKMCKAAKLSISVIEGEGCCSKLIMNTDITVKSTSAAVDIILSPNKIRALLRN